MSGDYTALAPVYDALGMGQFAEVMTPRLINFAQRNGWMGRQMVELGCGTGSSLIWLAQHSYSITAVDSSEPMLKLARQNFQQAQSSNQRMMTPEWLQQDIRSIDNPESTDMVIALNTLHELPDTKALTQVFTAAYKLLRPGRLFMFDMYTIEGLVRRAENEGLLHEDNALNVVTENAYDYDRQIQTRRYLIFRNPGDNTWQRTEAQRSLRAYPVQVIRGILQRSGFKTPDVITPGLERYTGETGTERVIFIAWKQ